MLLQAALSLALVHADVLDPASGRLFTPIDALGAATVNGAELLRISGRTAALRPGLEADLVVVDGSPLESLADLSDVLLVVNDGRVVLDRLRFGLDGRE